MSKAGTKKAAPHSVRGVEAATPTPSRGDRMTQAYPTTADGTTPGLSAKHRRVLVEGSGIDPEIIEERGVRTVTKGRELPAVYSWRQKKRAPGMVFTAHRPNGETCTIFRPDKPNPKNPGHKYEQECKARGGTGNVLDVHPRMRPLLDEPSVPLVFVEGIKKADALTSRGAVAVGISGVWNWLSEGEPISDMYEIPVEARRAYVCFDSDMLRKPEVLMAAERLAEHLEGRGAEVWIVYLRDQADGSKTGADDFLAGGGTLEQLLGLARPFDPEDLQREKLSRNERLRRSLDALMRREEEMSPKSRRDCSEKAAYRACRTLADKHGELVEDGIKVRVPAMTGAEIAAMSQPTFSKRMRDLEESGRIRRIKRQRSEHADSYVLLVDGGVDLYNDGGTGGAREQGRDGGEEGGSHRGYKVIPPPELRWSALMEDVPSVRRLGKKRGEILRYLLQQGGSATREELLECFGGSKTTWKDFKKQTLADLLGRRRQYRGQQLALGPPVVELDPDGIRLVEDWREVLEEHRRLGGEQEAAIEQKARHLRYRAAYREHLKGANPPDDAPTEEEMAERREARQKRLRVEQLVRQGMARDFAAEAVIGADGFIEDLRPTEDGDPPSADPPDAPAGHPLDCACLDCSAPMPRYATPFTMKELHTG
jgi:Domain of unknown function (DUF3854)